MKFSWKYEVDGAFEAERIPRREESFALATGPTISLLFSDCC